MRHRFHSICPYFAMFPEAFAETWVNRLTRRNDVVLDPFSGRGTTAFQSLLMGRRAVACDVNDVAYCLTKAKTNAPKLSSVKRRIEQLEEKFDGRKWRHPAECAMEFFHHAFHPVTLQQLIYLRDTLQWRKARVDTMLAALVLGSLHGEMDKSTSYLSNQMPRTISTKPAYSVRFWKRRRLMAPERNVFDLLRSRAVFRYESEPPERNAIVIHRDMRELPRFRHQLPQRIGCVITSPPYFDVTNFEEDQWLRLWFLGGPEYPTRGRISRDDRHSIEADYWRFIADMWRSLGAVVSKTAQVVIRIGSRRVPPDRLANSLKASSIFSKRRVEMISQEVSEVPKRQTDAFRPGTVGVSVEVDCHFRFRS